MKGNNKYIYEGKALYEAFLKIKCPKKGSSLHAVPKEVLPVILFLFPHKLLVFVVVVWVG
jgi:hypothetical protein